MSRRIDIAEAVDAMNRHRWRTKVAAKELGCLPQSLLQALRERAPEAHRVAVAWGLIRRGGQNYVRLTEQDVVEIRRRVANGETCASVARSYPGADQKTVWCAAKRITWRNVG